MTHFTQTNKVISICKRILSVSRLTTYYSVYLEYNPKLLSKKPGSSDQFSKEKLTDADCRIIQKMGLIRQRI